MNAHHVRQGRRRAVGAVLLEETQAHAQNHHGGDHHGRADVICETPGHERQHQQHAVEGCLDLQPKLDQHGGRLFPGDLVSTEGLDPFVHLGAG